MALKNSPMPPANAPIHYTGPEVIADLINKARAEYAANPRLVKALRVVCEESECAKIAADCYLLTPAARVLAPDLEDWSYTVYNHRKLLNPKYRQEVCIIAQPQYFQNLRGFLRAAGELVVLLCDPGHADTHNEMDLSTIMRRDLQPFLPPLRRVEYY